MYSYSFTRDPRRCFNTVDPDDYLQLQLLLRQEQERRQALLAEQERRRSAEAEYYRRQEERRRIEDALSRLDYLQRVREQQRLEEERRIRREQRYRTELLATLKATAEEEERYRVQAALERQKQWGAARRKSEDKLRKQRETVSSEEKQKRAQLEELLKHVLGYQYAETEGQDSDEEIPEQLDDDYAIWQKYYRPTFRLPRAQKIPKPTPANYRKDERPELKDHVIPLQVFLDNLLTNEQKTQQKKEDFATHHQDSDNALKNMADSAEARHHQQQKAEEKAFENFLNQAFQRQSTKQPTFHTIPIEEVKKPAAPKLSEEEAAAKIQNWYKTSHDAHAISQVTHQLAVLAEISTQLNKIQNECEQTIFTIPLTSATSSTTPKINKQWLQNEDEIMRVLVRLDTIESHGSDAIRERRRELVKQATSLLDRLDEYKQIETESKAEPYIIPEDEELKTEEVSELEAKEPEVKESEPEVQESEVKETKVEELKPEEPVVLQPTPGHPHPENPTATTVDDVPDDYSSPTVEVVVDPIANIVKTEESAKDETSNAPKHEDEGFVVV